MAVKAKLFLEIGAAFFLQHCNIAKGAYYIIFPTLCQAISKNNLPAPTASQLHALPPRCPPPSIPLPSRCQPITSLPTPPSAQSYPHPSHLISHFPSFPLIISVHIPTIILTRPDSEALTKVFPPETP